MPPRVGYSTPMLRVADVKRSLRFYELLGFEAVDVQGDGSDIGWARLHCDGGALMLAAAEKPVEASAQGVLLYMYSDDLPALRENLIANGVEVSPIGRPEHMPSGEIRLNDPDGYLVLVGQWGVAEHEAWETGRKDRLAVRGRGRSRPS